MILIVKIISFIKIKINNNNKDNSTKISKIIIVMGTITKIKITKWCINNSTYKIKTTIIINIKTNKDSWTITTTTIITIKILTTWTLNNKISINNKICTSNKCNNNNTNNSNSITTDRDQVMVHNKTTTIIIITITSTTTIIIRISKQVLKMLIFLMEIIIIILNKTLMVTIETYSMVDQIIINKIAIIEINTKIIENNNSKTALNL